MALNTFVTRAALAMLTTVSVGQVNALKLKPMIIVGGGSARRTADAVINDEIETLLKFDWRKRYSSIQELKFKPEDTRFEEIMSFANNRTFYGIPKRTPRLPRAEITTLHNTYLDSIARKSGIENTSVNKIMQKLEWEAERRRRIRDQQAALQKSAEVDWRKEDKNMVASYLNDGQGTGPKNLALTSRAAELKSRKTELAVQKVRVKSRYYRLLESLRQLKDAVIPTSLSSLSVRNDRTKEVPLLVTREEAERRVISLMGTGPKLRQVPEKSESELEGLRQEKENACENALDDLRKRRMLN